MIVLSGAALVLPDRILSPGTLVIDNGRIVEIRPDTPSSGSHSQFAFHGHYVVPGFIDVHVHGVEGIDSLDVPPDDQSGAGAIAEIAARLPRYGVTAFCPTTVACAPDALRRVLGQIRRAREMPLADGARVLGAHLESNFINPEYRGAQPLACLRQPPPKGIETAGGAAPASEFTGDDILREIERGAPDVGIVTLAPELDGALDLVQWLAGRGHRVSLGHSAATYDQAVEAIARGARQATHLFNRMPPFVHRAPGLAGAVLQTDEVAAEIICDGVHVHPAVVRTAVLAKKPSRILGITDGTAAAGLAVGRRAKLGGQPIVAGEHTAVLEDGTLAGSRVTMDEVFRNVVNQVGLSLVDAATICSTTAARELGLIGHGVLAEDAVADLVVLDSNLGVVQTYVAGQLVFARNPAVPGSV
jgi:N-acetylglucosamine-6-phosphate deacetylase